jgi:hypothetical protein
MQLPLKIILLPVCVKETKKAKAIAATNEQDRGWGSQVLLFIGLVGGMEVTEWSCDLR